MRIDQLLASKRPVFSVEFFPPKTDEGQAMLLETVHALKPLEPDYVSVTYGAGGSTRDGTVEMVARMKDEFGLEAMAHLSCVGETREGLRALLDRFHAAGIENVMALRGDPPRGETDFTPPENGLSSATELISFIGDGYDFTLEARASPRSIRRLRTCRPTSAI